MSHFANYKSQAPWHGITMAELKAHFPNWVYNNDQLCEAFICPVEDCPVLGYRTRHSWCNHVNNNNEADHAALRTGKV